MLEWIQLVVLVTLADLTINTLCERRTDRQIVHIIHTVSLVYMESYEYFTRSEKSNQAGHGAYNLIHHY